MLIVLGLGGAIVLYILLLTILPRHMRADAVRRPLQWAHWGSGVVVVAAMLVSCSSWDLSIRYPLLFTLVVVSSGLVAGFRTKLTLVSGRAWLLARTQSLLTPVLIPLLYIWAAVSLGDIVYRDAKVSIEVTKNTGMLSETTTTWVALYQPRGILFEERIGYLYATDYPSNRDRSAEDFNNKDWWATVGKVTVDADALKGVAQNYSGSHPFLVGKPWRNQPAQPAAPAQVPPPVEDNKVYTYVEEMPQLPGYPGNVVGALTQAIHAWLVLPPNAVEGRLLLRLEVNKQGDVRHLRIVQGLNASTDSAVLAAAHLLPRLVPGRQNGQPMNVALTLPITVAKASARRGQRARP